MPDIGGTIRAITLADATVSGYVSTRMYSDQMPSNRVFPAITYRVVSTVPAESLTTIEPIAQARLEITANSSSRAEANALGDAIRIALQMKHRGTAADGQNIHNVSMVGGEQYSVVLKPGTGADIHWFETTLDFYIHYTTTTS